MEYTRISGFWNVISGAQGLEFLTNQYFMSENLLFSTEFKISLHYLAKKIPYSII